MSLYEPQPVIFVALPDGAWEVAVEELCRRDFRAQRLTVDELEARTAKSPACCVLIDFETAMEEMPERLIDRSGDAVPILISAENMDQAAPLAHADPHFVDIVADKMNPDDSLVVTDTDDFHRGSDAVLG